MGVLGGSLTEFDHTTLRIAFAAIHAHYEDRVHRYNEAHSLAVLSGMVANMPYMQDSDRRKFQQQLEQHGKEEDKPLPIELTPAEREAQRQKFNAFAQRIAASKGITLLKDQNGEVIS